MKNQSQELEKFDATVRKVLNVSRDELKRREEQWKEQHDLRKAGRKPTKTAASDRASTAKG
jgi:hypothetical protein